VGEIQADIVEEAKRLLDLAASDGVPLRVLGGVAIRLRAPGELPAALGRDYGDADFVTAKGSSSAVQRLLRATGYEPHVAFNALHGTERLLFFDNGNERQVDVFVGGFMCATCSRCCTDIPSRSATATRSTPLASPRCAAATGDSGAR
jgi:hypothetical protein